MITRRRSEFTVDLEFASFRQGTPVRHFKDFHLAFTLLELLAVMAVIGTLAALLFPALGRAKAKAQVLVTQVEMAQIASAINEYESAYGRFPVSNEALREAARAEEDFTYGGVIEDTQTWIAGPGDYLTNNSEVMALLLDLEEYGNGVPTINKGHVKNPHRTRFLPATVSTRTNGAVGPDGLYRDPWGCPYFITLDLNHDGAARDVMYRNPAVSGDSDHPGRGLHGLVKKTDLKGNTCFEANQPGMIWSAGPDRHIDSHGKADHGFNRDNVLSWKR